MPAGGTILELGAGEGTGLLAAAGYTVVSVEHDPAWAHQATGVEYVIAPLVPVAGIPPYPDREAEQESLWYDPDVLLPAVARRSFDVLLIDGPPGSIGRMGAMLLLDRIRIHSAVVVDDTHRPAENKLCRLILRHYNRQPDQLRIVRDGWRETAAIVIAEAVPA